MRPRVILADPALKDQRGHHFSLTQNLSDHLLAYGFEVIWLVHKDFQDFEVCPGVTIHRVFSVGTYDAHRQKTNNAAKTLTVSNEEAEKYHLIKTVYRTIPLSYREWLTPRIRSGVHYLRHGQRLRIPPKVNRTAQRMNGAKALSVREQVETALNRKKNAVDQVLKPENELYRALKLCKSTAEDSVVFHTSDAHTYRDVLAFFCRVARIPEWNDFPEFHLSTPYDDQIMPHNNDYPDFEMSLRRLGALGLLGKRVFLHAENRLLADYLSKLTSFEFQPLPIPAPTLKPPEIVPGPRKWTIAYLGAARTEKGFAEIVSAVLEVLASKSWSDISFVIQASPQIMGYTPDVKDAVQQLINTEDNRLTLITDTQDRDQYDQVLHAADVMLLCYQQARYAQRSSGIAVECVVSNTSMISTKDTFPAYLAQQKALEVNDGDPQSIADAIVYSYEHQGELTSAARVRQRCYLNSHGGNAFIGQIHKKGLRLKEPQQIPFERFNDDTTWKRLV